MEIKTKHNIGDTLWGISYTKARKFKVVSIEITYSDGKTLVRYGDEAYNKFPEAQCFTSKEEVYDYIFRDEEDTEGV